MKKPELQKYIASLPIEKVIELADQHGVTLSGLEHAALSIIPDVQNRIIEAMFPSMKRSTVEKLDEKINHQEPVAEDAKKESTKAVDEKPTTQSEINSETKSERKRRQRNLQVQGYKDHKTRPKLAKQDRTPVEDDHKIGRSPIPDSKNNLRGQLNMFLERKGFKVQAGKMSSERREKRDELIAEGIEGGFLHKKTEQFLSGN